MLHTTTNSGLHDFVCGHVSARPGAQAVNRSANGFDSSGKALLGDNHVFVLEAAP
jgi:hypothetical protein